MSFKLDNRADLHEKRCPPTKRVVRQASITWNNRVIAVANDGTIWALVNVGQEFEDRKWRRLPDLPQEGEK